MEQRRQSTRRLVRRVSFLAAAFVVTAGLAVQGQMEAGVVAGAFQIVHHVGGPLSPVIGKLYHGGGARRKRRLGFPWQFGPGCAIMKRRVQRGEAPYT